jgi:hypothetical protein
MPAPASDESGDGRIEIEAEDDPEEILRELEKK